MYESFYGLSEKPFNLTPDPRYLFLSDKHKEAFAHLLYGIKNRCGFVMVTGEIGTGKTTICRTLLNQLEDDTEVAFIFNPRLSPEDLLRTINEDFGIASKGETVKELIDELNAYLLERNAQGKNCVLVIDESQNLVPPVLEQIRLLSNLETETQKLLQIVLIGQPELAQKLALPELRQLNQRITARYHLKSLDRQETAQYIAHRLHTAGGHKKVRFARGAIKRAYRFSGGTPRVINAVCDRALLVGYTREVHDISAAIMAKAAREVRGERIRMKRAPKPADTHPFPWRMVAAAAMVALMLGATLYGPLLLERSAWAPGTAAENAAPMAAERRPDIARAATDIGVPEPASSAVDSFALAPLADGGPAVDDADALLDEAPAPTPFQLAVGRVEPSLARNAAAQAILRAWRMAMVGDYPGGDTMDSLRAFAEQNGFEHEALPLTLDQLRSINLPAFVRMTTDRHPVWVALIGCEDPGVRLTTTMGEALTVDEEEFTKRYLGEAILVWRDPRAGDPVLMDGVQGEPVRALQQAMRDAGHYEGEVTGVFDSETEEAVNKVQESAGLVVDGKVGRQTRMAMAAWLGVDGVPVLRQRPEDAEVVAEQDEDETTRSAAGTEEGISALGEPNMLALFERPGQSILPGLAGNDDASAPDAASISEEPGEPDESAETAALLASIEEDMAESSPAGGTNDALGSMFDALRAAIAGDDEDTVADIAATLGHGDEPDDEPAESGDSAEDAP